MIIDAQAALPFMIIRTCKRFAFLGQSMVCLRLLLGFVWFGKRIARAAEDFGRFIAEQGYCGAAVRDSWCVPLGGLLVRHILPTCLNLVCGHDAGISQRYASWKPRPSQILGPWCSTSGTSGPWLAG